MHHGSIGEIKTKLVMFQIHRYKFMLKSLESLETNHYVNLAF
jgi:hypothetical protein